MMMMIMMTRTLRVARRMWISFLELKHHSETAQRRTPKPLEIEATAGIATPIIALSCSFFVQMIDVVVMMMMMMMMMMMKIDGLEIIVFTRIETSIRFQCNALFVNAVYNIILEYPHKGTIWVVTAISVASKRLSSLHGTRCVLAMTRLMTTTPVQRKDASACFILLPSLLSVEYYYDGRGTE
jgi:hypothetical protein